MSIETCDHCRFWKSHEDSFGECRKNAPLAHFAQENQFASWPITASGDWCGKWRPAKVKSADETISPSQMLVIEYLRNETDGAMAKEISESTNVKIKTTRMMLWRLAKKGLVKKVDGKWFAIENNDTDNNAITEGVSL